MKRRRLPYAAAKTNDATRRADVSSQVPNNKKMKKKRMNNDTILVCAVVVEMNENVVDGIFSLRRPNESEIFRWQRKIDVLSSHPKGTRFNIFPLKQMAFDL